MFLGLIMFNVDKLHGIYANIITDTKVLLLSVLCIVSLLMLFDAIPPVV